MRKYLSILFILILVSCSSIGVGSNFQHAENSLQHAQPGDIVKATVISVSDGDTVHVKTPANEKAKVRILSIDTPELKGSRNRNESQPFAVEAKKRGEQLLLGETVYLELSLNEEPYDQYDRLLANIWIDSENLYQEIMVEEGLARIAYVFEPDTKYVDRLKKAEKKAKSDKIGIWSIEGYVGERGFQQ